MSFLLIFFAANHMQWDAGAGPGDVEISPDSDTRLQSGDHVGLLAAPAITAGVAMASLFVGHRLREKAFETR